MSSWTDCHDMTHWPHVQLSGTLQLAACFETPDTIILDISGMISFF